VDFVFLTRTTWIDTVGMDGYQERHLSCNTSDADRFNSCFGRASTAPRLTWSDLQK